MSAGRCPGLGVQHPMGSTPSKGRRRCREAQMALSWFRADLSLRLSRDTDAAKAYELAARTENEAKQASHGAVTTCWRPDPALCRA